MQVKISDSGARENPFGTAFGQEAVSIVETYYARMIRAGGRIITPGTFGSDNMTNTTGSKALSIFSMTVQPGMKIHLAFLVLSSDVDCTPYLKVITGYTPSAIAPEQMIFELSVNLKAGTPFVWPIPPGLFFAEDTGISGSAPGFYIGYQTTVAGKLWAPMIGVEVARDA